MPINNIPGVGPTNADIATAVAAPSAATIAAAVAAPSSSTIATAVAAAVPTLSQINTAVNTQTNNSAIATAVAAAVPTTAGITSIVQANAGSPFGGSWTSLGQITVSSGNTISITGLSGYKKYRIYFQAYCSTTDYTINARINGNATGIYHYGVTRYGGAGVTTPIYVEQSSGNSSFVLTPGLGIYNGFTATGILDFDQASSAQWKTITGDVYYYIASASQNGVARATGYCRDTAAINSLSLNTNATYAGTCYINVYGGN